MYRSVDLKSLEYRFMNFGPQTAISPSHQDPSFSMHEQPLLLFVYCRIIMQ